MPLLQLRALIIVIFGELGPEIEVLAKLTESHGTGISVANFITLSLQLGSERPALACRNLNGVGLMVCTKTEAFQPEHVMLLSYLK